jgi:hypothetical protein
LHGEGGGLDGGWVPGNREELGFLAVDCQFLFLAPDEEVIDLVLKHVRLSWRYAV